VFPQIDKYQTGITYAERSLLFHNRGQVEPIPRSAGSAGSNVGTRKEDADLKVGATGGALGIRFDEVGRRSGPGFAIRKVGRGLATADYDNDGDVEFAVTNMNDSPDLIRHARKNKNHSILVKTIGVTSNRDGIGTEVKVVSGQLTQYDWVRSGASYLSSSDLRLHFGLGKSATIDRIELHWLSGQNDVISNPPIDSVLTVKEGKGLIQSRPFRRTK